MVIFGMEKDDGYQGNLSDLKCLFLGYVLCTFWKLVHDIPIYVRAKLYAKSLADSSSLPTLSEANCTISSEAFLM